MHYSTTDYISTLSLPHSVLATFEVATFFLPIFGVISIKVGGRRRLEGSTGEPYTPGPKVLTFCFARTGDLSIGATIPNGWTTSVHDM